MQLSRALSLCTVPFTLATLLGQSFAVPCAIDEGLTGLGEPISLEGKLSIFGFSASVSYVTLPAGSTPFLTILSASEQPEVSLEDGILTISTDSCEATLTPTESPSDSPTSSAPIMMTGLISTVFAPRGVGSVLFATSLMGFLTTGVSADGHVCTPSLEIEISIPSEATVTEKFGDTDHYLAATVDTVTWGYYDPDATPVISMESGETITVEVITHHSGHDYAKMILGDPAVEEIFYWANGTSAEDKAEPKLPGSGVHLVTGPIEVVGAEVGDIIQVDILELDPRLNPATGRCFGTNSQKFAGYQYNRLIGYKRDGTQYVRTGGTEAITVFEFLETDEGAMIWGEPVYMYRYPNMTAPDGSIRTFDNNPAVIIPHEFNYGYEGELLETDPIIYPEGFDGFKVTDEGGIIYLSPEEAKLNWKVPLRPHLGTLAVMPNNTANYIDDAAPGGASTIPPSRFGGNIDDWRIGKGGTMYYKVEVPGANIVVGDTHAAQGDSELAGTAMETSMTTKLRVTLHKAGSLPKKVATLDFPLLEVDDKFVVHGFAYENYLDELEDPSDIFSVGTSLDLAMADCFNNTRAWLMDVFDLIEEETIALMTTSVDFGITQVVDGNWGVHADIPKWVFDDTGAAYDYTCTTSKTAGRRLKTEKERRRILEAHGVDDIQDYADDLFARVTAGCDACADSVHAQHVGRMLLDAKLVFAKKRMDAAEEQARRRLFSK